MVVKGCRGRWLEVQREVVGGAERGCWRCRARLLEVQSQVVGGAYNKVMVKAGRNSLHSQTRTMKECAYKGNLQANFPRHVSNKKSATEPT